jgi:hypothetical protein
MTPAPLTPQNKRRYLNTGIKLLFACAFGFCALQMGHWFGSKVSDHAVLGLSLACLLVMGLFIWLAALSVHATHQPGSNAT